MGNSGVYCSWARRHLGASVTIIVLFGATLAGYSGQANAQSSSKLQVYFVDVEGGQSTLFVAPGGHSLLIDTGWPREDGRDAERIAAVAKRAGIQKIDSVLITHYHDDHVGGVQQLVQRIPVGTFIDHGPNRETTGSTEKNWEAYQKLLATGKYKHIVAKPGDVFTFGELKTNVISADGKSIEHPLPGAGEQNSYCAKSETRPADQTENSRSLGTLLTFGKLRILDLGDLTWDKEMQLMCPVNKLGKVDVLVVSHHGWYQSSSPALVDAIRARVAIMDNGETKGGSTPTLETVSKAPGLEAMWQIHYSKEGGAAHNAKPEYIANLPGEDKANYIELLGSQDGAVEVFNARTEKTSDYAAR